MPRRKVAAARPPLLIGVLAVLGVLAAAAWLRPVTAQDATPAASPLASPVASPGAMGTVDCAELLGIGLPGDGCLRVVNAAPEIEAAAVYLDGRLIVSNVAFGKASSAFFAVLVGEHRLQIGPVGPEGIAAAVIDQTISVQPGQAYEIAVAGPLASVQALVNPVNLDPVAEGNARIRVIQTIADAPPADVGVVGGDVLIPNIAFPTATDYVEVPGTATPMQLEIRSAGLGIGLPLPGVTLEPGIVYSLYPVGQLAQPWTVSVLVVAAPTGGLGAGATVPAPASLSLNLAPPPAGTPAP